MQPDAARKGEDRSPTDVAIPGAEPGREAAYWYKDRWAARFEHLTILASVVWLARALAGAACAPLHATGDGTSGATAVPS